jgi:hypothetical protein
MEFDIVMVPDALAYTNEACCCWQVGGSFISVLYVVENQNVLLWSYGIDAQTYQEYN